MNRAPRHFRVLAVLLVAGALVSGCGKRKSADSASQAAAGGKVLEGTISDAMIDLDSQTAQAPLAPRAPDATPTEDAEEKTVAKEVVQQAEAPQPAASAGGDLPSGD
ncbi:MAG: hypothetical protein KGL48_12040 [Sphingomonadales bacterium]|nr:hypothetical protein [Sphingomonadales bacterium]MDE2568271.1 hypothetical protein [Sphingomonadales bacterium]